ncbi:MAG: glycosyltransferase [Eubacterium sp.]|nr:glycosyltransferase [Eubacterium sp.]
MSKILYVATVVKNHIMEFHVPYLKMLKEMGWETAVAAKNDYDNKGECVIPYCDTFYDIPFERNPFRFDNIKAYKELKQIIDKGEYDIIHCHTPVGALITRLAAQDARKKGTRVFYTAHGFHFYKGAPLINWIVYYSAEKYLARKTDVLITITKEDYQRAKKFNAKHVEYIPGVGIDLNHYKRDNLELAKQLKSDLGIPASATVLLSVGEVNANKNHKLIIQALQDFPDAWFVLCGQGPLIQEYRKLADDLGVGDRVIMTGYRTDVINFYRMADIFILPSLREGLPVALMEAMSMGLVCVASRNRGTDELLRGSRLLFSATSVKELKEKLMIAMKEDCSDEVKRNSLHLKDFDLSNTLKSMKTLYQQEVLH